MDVFRVLPGLFRLVLDCQTPVDSRDGSHHNALHRMHIWSLANNSAGTQPLPPMERRGGGSGFYNSSGPRTDDRGMRPSASPILRSQIDIY